MLRRVSLEILSVPLGRSALTRSCFIRDYSLVVILQLNGMVTLRALRILVSSGRTRVDSMRAAFTSSFAAAACTTAETLMDRRTLLPKANAVPWPSCSSGVDQADREPRYGVDPHFQFGVVVVHLVASAVPASRSGKLSDDLLPSSWLFPFSG